MISFAGCDYASVERANKQHLNPLLTRLVRTPFFRYFKVNLWCDCSFWPDDSMCMLRDCSVCECADEEIPQIWKAAEDSCKGKCLPAFFSASHNSLRVFTCCMCNTAVQHLRSTVLACLWDLGLLCLLLQMPHTSASPQSAALEPVHANVAPASISTNHAAPPQQPQSICCISGIVGITTL